MTLRVQQGSELVVNAVNEGDLEATVHWQACGLRTATTGRRRRRRRCRSAAASPTARPTGFAAKVIGDLMEAGMGTPRGVAVSGKALALDTRDFYLSDFPRSIRDLREKERRLGRPLTLGEIYGSGARTALGAYPRTRSLGRHVAEAVREDLRHPLRHPGRTLLDVAVLGGGVAATARTASVAGRAAQAARVAAAKPRTRAVAVKGRTLSPVPSRYRRSSAKFTRDLAREARKARPSPTKEAVKAAREQKRVKALAAAAIARRGSLRERAAEEAKRRSRFDPRRRSGV